MIKTCSISIWNSLESPVQARAVWLGAGWIPWRWEDSFPLPPLVISSAPQRIVQPNGWNNFCGLFCSPKLEGKVVRIFMGGDPPADPSCPWTTLAPVHIYMGSSHGAELCIAQEMCSPNMPLFTTSPSSSHTWYRFCCLGSFDGHRRRAVEGGVNLPLVGQQ